jgi:hypothetical protein
MFQAKQNAATPAKRTMNGKIRHVLQRSRLLHARDFLQTQSGTVLLSFRNGTARHGLPRRQESTRPAAQLINATSSALTKERNSTGILRPAHVKVTPNPVDATTNRFLRTLRGGTQISTRHGTERSGFRQRRAVSATVLSITSAASNATATTIGTVRHVKLKQGFHLAEHFLQMRSGTPLQA